MTNVGQWRVGNAAHASGAILGILLGLAIVTQGARRAIPIAALMAGIVVAFIGGALATPQAQELAYVGYQDLEHGRFELGVEKYERAVELDANQADWWQNLGNARYRLGRYEGAVEAFRHATLLSPHDHEKRENFYAAKAELAFQRHMSGDFQGAIVLYRELLDDKSQSALTWYNLGLAYLELGRTEAARDAFERAVKLDPADKRFRSVLLDLSAVTKEKK